MTIINSLLSLKIINIECVVGHFDVIVGELR